MITLKTAMTAQSGMNEALNDMGEHSHHTTRDTERTSLADVRVVGMQFLEVVDDLLPC